MSARPVWNWVVVAVVLVGATALLSNPGASRGDQATSAPTAQGQKQRLFELRIYTAAAGKMERLHKRFREHALPMFAKYEIECVGFWTAVGEDRQERLYYILAYADEAAREKSLINGIAKDAGFLKAVAESEADGKLTAGIESVLMRATDYSRIR